MLKVLCIFFVIVIISFIKPRKASAFNMGYHYDLIREAMVKEGFNKDAYSVSLAGNSYTDLFQAEQTEYAVDNKFCEESKKLVSCLHFDQLYNEELIEIYWRTLIQNTYNAVVEKINKNDKLGLLMVMGVSLHIVADFYAHSNWAELDLPGYTNVKDATYFEVIKNFATELQSAIYNNDAKPFKRYDYEYGLFTHGNDTVLRPVHDEVLNKDYASRPHFDWSYRAAYKASLQWVRLIKKWVCEDLNNQSFWNSLKNYSYPHNRDRLYKLTSFDEGTIRWLCTYGGAWKMPERWGKADIVADDLPNVPGIGVDEQYTQDYPYLGIEWFENCALVAVGLFEALEMGKVKKLTGVNGLARALAGDSEDFEDTVDVKLDRGVNVSSLSRFNTNIVRDAISYMATTLGNSYDNVKWLRIHIPKAKDLDVGDDYFGVNNEETGGTSDYWVMFNVGGLEYSEAEYVDQSSPETLWGVLKPLWNTSAVDVTIKMYESDPSDHTDERMDIRPGSGKNLSFTFYPSNKRLTNLPDGCSWYSIPDGYFIKSSGSGDLRARVYVKVWIMSDTKIEFIGHTNQIDNADTNACIWGHVGGRMWLLDQLHFNNFEGEIADIFTFDPGSDWSKDKLTRFQIHKDKSDDWHMKNFYTKAGNRWMGRNANSWLTDNNLTYDFGGTSPHLVIDDVEDKVKYFTVITKTVNEKNAETDDDVFISFINKDGGVLAKYNLDDFIRNDFQRGNWDFFFLREQKNIGGHSYTNSNFFSIKEIAKIKLEKPGEDDWKLEKLEVWVNDKVLYQGSPNFSFTDETNPKRLSWETNVYIPKKIYLDDSVKVISEGINSVSNNSNVKGHRYKVEAKVNLVGYTSAPDITWELTPKPAYTNFVSQIHTKEYAKIRMYIYMNKSWNHNSNYQIKVKVESGNQTKTAYVSFTIPQPDICVNEKSFVGGERIVNKNGKKLLQYIGTYDYTSANFGVSENQLSPRGMIDTDNAKILSYTPSELKLLFEVPPLKYDHQMNVVVKDQYNVQEAADDIQIKLPKIACKFEKQYLKKYGSFFNINTNKLKSIKDKKTSTSYIQEVLVQNPIYGNYVGQFREIIALYNSIKITAKPYMKRGTVSYLNKVHDPKYVWKVETSDRELSFTHPKIRRMRLRKKPIKKNNSRIIPERISIEKHPIYEFFEQELESIIVIDATDVKVGEKIKITCEITDAVGQKEIFKEEVTKNTGISPWKVVDFNLKKVLKYLREIHPELIKWDINDPIPGPDPLPIHRLSRKEQQLLKTWGTLRDYYVKYRDQDLKANISELNEKLVTEFINIVELF